MTDTSVKKLDIKELLDAGLHFGHQTKRWNPKMKRYIHGAKNGIYIILASKKDIKFFKVTQLCLKK